VLVRAAPRALARARLVVAVVAVTPSCDPRRMEINCDDCVMQHTSTCDDCVVSFIVDRQPGEAIVIDAEEERAVRLLADAGLVPELRHRRRAG
jgi:hypothetical protein